MDIVMGFGLAALAFGYTGLALWLGDLIREAGSPGFGILVVLVLIFGAFFAVVITVSGG